MDNTSVSFPFFRSVPTSQDMCSKFIYEDELFACDENQAPAFKWRKPSSINYPGHSCFYSLFLADLLRLAVHRICTLQSDLSRIKKERFPKFTNSKGKEFYDLRYDLRMGIIDEVLKFEMLFEGQNCGTVTAEFD